MRRKLLDLSQADLAKGLNLTFQQIQKYARGTNRISASMLYALANLLGVDPAWFFEGLPTTDSGLPADRAELEAARAIQALMSSPDGRRSPNCCLTCRSIAAAKS